MQESFKINVADNKSVSQSVKQSVAFARMPVTGDHWHRTSNLIKSIDKNRMTLTKMFIANSKQVPNYTAW